LRFFMKERRTAIPNNINQPRAWPWLLAECYYKN
jgi:hypothetical protein